MRPSADKNSTAPEQSSGASYDLPNIQMISPKVHGPRSGSGALSALIGDRAPVEARCELTFLRFNAHYKTDVAIVDVLVVVVLDLHDLVAGRERPPEPFYFAVAGGIKGGL